MVWLRVIAALLAAGALLSLAFEWKTRRRIRRGKAEIDDLLDYAGSADPAVLDSFSSVTLLQDDWVEFDPSASRRVSQRWTKRFLDSPASDSLELAGALYMFVYPATALALVILAMIVLYELAGGICGLLFIRRWSKIWAKGFEWEDDECEADEFSGLSREALVKRLQARDIELGLLPEAIRRFTAISNPYHIRIAKDVIAGYLNHEDPSVRYNAMFSLGYCGRCPEFANHFLAASASDTDSENRGCAAFCLGAVLSGSKDASTVTSLARLVLDDRQELITRLKAYGGMLLLFHGGSADTEALSFAVGDKELRDINLAWVRYHALDSESKAARAPM